MAARGAPPSATPHELQTHAIRTVVATCLYGADINAMAVEMCKLSLWLVSLDPKLPFSFVDDKVLHGNSLLGLTDVAQLKRQHIDPERRERRSRACTTWTWTACSPGPRGCAAASPPRSTTATRSAPPRPSAGSGVSTRS